MTKRMRCATFFLACLMVLMTSWSGVAHAVECVGSPTTSVMQQARQAQAICDEKQAPKKTSKPCLHCQAGCHSQNIAAPVGLAVPTLLLPQERMFDDLHRVALITHVGDQALRPPQA